VHGLHLVTVFLASCFIASSALAADLKILSAGALEAGLVPLARAYGAATGHNVRVEIATPPAIRQRLIAGETADIVIVPPAVLEDPAIVNGIDMSSRRLIGRVGIGIAVHVDAEGPSIATANDVRTALMAAESVVYNTASTGIYFVKLIEQMGIADAVKAKATIYPSGQEVMAHLTRSSARARILGIGPLTEIHLYLGKGVKLVGPLPSDIQNYTSYVGALTRGKTTPAADFLESLRSPTAQEAFRTTGVEVSAPR